MSWDLRNKVHLILYYQILKPILIWSPIVLRIGYSIILFVRIFLRKKYRKKQKMMTDLIDLIE